MQNINNWLGKGLKVTEFFTIAWDNKTKAEIAEILVNSTTTGKSPGYPDIMLLNVILVDFFKSILVSSNNDAWFFIVKKH